MSVEVVAWSPDWAVRFEAVADVLRGAVADVRDVLRRREDLRDAYAAAKLALAADPATGLDDYLAGKSAVVQHRLNDPSV